MKTGKLIWLLKIFIITLFAVTSGNVYAEYYIVSEPLSDYSYSTYNSPRAYAEEIAPCDGCASHHPRHHYHHRQTCAQVYHPVYKHHKHHYRSCNHCSGGCSYSSTHYSSPVFFTSHDEQELDFDRRTADDIRTELQIDD